jgi:hypothetical protein
MIAEITTITQYGRQGKIGINLHGELDEPSPSAFAHSVQDALEWAKSYPLYASATITDLGDGRYLVDSSWIERDTIMDGIEWDDAHLQQIKRTTHQRQRLTIIPRNTIYETPAFGGRMRDDA